VPNLVTRREYVGGAAQTTITAGINASDTSISITSSSGWPTGATGPWVVAIDPGLSTEEKVLIQSRSGTTLTVAGSGRGYDNTSAVSHSAAAVIYPVFPAIEANELNEHASKSTTVHGVTGSVVGTTDTQTLSGKTLTSPTINGATVTGTVAGGTFTGSTLTAPTMADFTNAAHDHGDADDGGATAHEALTATHGATGAVVGTTNTQTLTNKTINGATLSGTLAGGTFTGSTLTAPTMADFTNAAHDHGDADDGGPLALGALSALQLFARKTATESVTSSTTLQDDDELTVTVVANTVYAFDAVIFYDGSASGVAGDLKLRWVGPAGATLTVANLSLISSATGTQGDLMDGQIINTDINIGTLGAGTTLAAVFRGLLIVAGTGGTYKAQWAQLTSGATATRLLADSHMILRQVA